MFEFPLRVAYHLTTPVLVEATEMERDFELPNSGTGPYYRVAYKMDKKLNWGRMPSEAVLYYYTGPGFPHLYDHHGIKVIDQDLYLDEFLIRYTQLAINDFI